MIVWKIYKKFIKNIKRWLLLISTPNFFLHHKPKKSKKHYLNNISLLINNVLNWIYSKDGYYSLKSGLYLDHYIKSFFHKIYKEIVFYTGLLFMDKFISDKIINNFFKGLNFVKEKINLFKLKNKISIIRIFITFILIFIVIIFLLYI